MNDYPGKGKCIASLVLGIAGLVFAWAGYGALASIAASIVGIVLGVNGRKQAEAVGAPTGMATAGIVCSVVALALSCVVFVACVLCVGAGLLLA